MSRSISSFISWMAWRDAGGARRGGGEEERPADEDEAGAERQGFQHVRAAAHAAVEHHRHVGHGGDDLRQDPHGRHRAVELPPAVVGHDQAVDARLARQSCVLAPTGCP